MPVSRRFDDHWGKYVGTGRTTVRADLVSSCRFGRSFCFPIIIIIKLLLYCSRSFYAVIMTHMYNELSDKIVICSCMKFIDYGRNLSH